MNAIQSAHRAAYRRQVAAAGEEILLDGHPVLALVGAEETLPELGPDGEPISGASLVVVVSADSVAPATLSHGVRLHVRGREYGLESTRTPSDAYHELTLYRR